ncbi:MAG TPA: hypothetical protein VFJ16_32545 [Longimicrobium sp.]|nr:hypothetical protein [Longimicrobium sp.]
MPGCPTIILPGVTPQVWECLKAQARRFGLPVPENGSGTVTAQGASAEYRWDEDTGTLEITFAELPQWVDCASVAVRLREAVRSCAFQQASS